MKYTVAVLLTLSVPTMAATDYCGDNCPQSRYPITLPTRAPYGSPEPFDFSSIKAPEKPRSGIVIGPHGPYGGTPSFPANSDDF